MEYINFFRDIFSSLSGLGFLVGIIVLYKTGLLGYLLTLKKNGNGNYQAQIDELKKHTAVANQEMEEVKNNLVSINTKLEIIMRHLKL